jgi:hypothetical protein
MTLRSLDRAGVPHGTLGRGGTCYSAEWHLRPLLGRAPDRACYSLKALLRTLLVGRTLRVYRMPQPKTPGVRLVEQIKSPFCVLCTDGRSKRLEPT